MWLYPGHCHPAQVIRLGRFNTPTICQLYPPCPSTAKDGALKGGPSCRKSKLRNDITCVIYLAMEPMGVQGGGLPVWRNRPLFSLASQCLYLINHYFHIWGISTPSLCIANAKITLPYE